MIRRIYDWCISEAEKPRAGWIMGAISFAESSFLPLPPDVMMIPMSLARPDKAWYYATLCTLTSVAGGLLGYYIGAMLYDTVGHWLLYGYADKIEVFRDYYSRWGALAIVLKGFTPIPYKIVTITSGFAGYNLPAFIALSLVARGMRFYFFAFMLNRYGMQARATIERHLVLWVGVATAVIVVGVIAATQLF